MGRIFDYIQSAFHLANVSPLISLIAVALMVVFFGLVGKALVGTDFGLVIGGIVGALFASAGLIQADKQMEKAGERISSERVIAHPQTFAEKYQKLILEGEPRKEQQNYTGLKTYKPKLLENENLISYNSEIYSYLKNDCFRPKFVFHIAQDSRIELPDSIWIALIEMKVVAGSMGFNMSDTLLTHISNFADENISLYENEIISIKASCNLN